MKGLVAVLTGMQGRRRSLRREWAIAFAIMLMLLSAMSAVSLLGVTRLVDEISATAHLLDRETAAANRLRSGMIEHEQAGHQLLLGKPIDREAFIRQQAAVADLFSTAIQVFPTTDPGARNIIATVFETWRNGLTDARLWGANRVLTIQGAHPAADLEFGVANDKARALLDNLSQPEHDPIQKGLAYDAQLERALIVVLAIVFGLALSITVYFRRRMYRDLTRPVANMHAAVLQLQDGSYAHRIEVTRRDELGELGEAFNSMASALEANHLELAFRERQFRTFFDQAPVGVALISADGVIDQINVAGAAMFGYEPDQLRGRAAVDLLPPGTGDSARTATIESSRRAERLCTRSDGSTMPVQVTIGSLAADRSSGSATIAIIEDVAELKELEVSLRHAQKLEAVGQLAAGIAHEINTPIQFIGDNVRFLNDAFSDLLRLRHAYAAAVDDARECGASIRALEEEIDVAFIEDETPAAIEQTLAGVDRVATIVRAMKAFGYTVSDEKAPADLNEAITNTLVVAASELKYVADVETSFAELPAVWCHVGDINQVMLNLVINAAHAITAADNGRGVIRVSTRVETGTVVIDVTDSGTGMPPEVAERVFEPFFTTKEVGKGTGQGLALCWTLVVDRHHGTLTVDTTPGAGTTFTVRLPIDGQLDASTPPKELTPSTR